MLSELYLINIDNKGLSYEFLNDPLDFGGKLINKNQNGYGFIKNNIIINETSPRRYLLHTCLFGHPPNHAPGTVVPKFECPETSIRIATIWWGVQL